MDTSIYFAPLQSYTTLPYYFAFNSLIPDVDKYFTPFYRISAPGTFSYEKELRYYPEINLVPQVLTNSASELKLFAKDMIERGFKEININLGCPFLMVANRQLGSGFLPFADQIKNMLDEFFRSGLPVQLSVKSRLGWDNKDTVFDLIQILNAFPISEVILHPRLGTQKYKGHPDWDVFSDVLGICTIDMIGNGDILSLKDLNLKMEQFPKAKGWMLGRALLADPCLLNKKLQYLDTMVKLHDLFHNNLLESGYAEGQIINHLRCFWEYPSQIIQGGSRVHRRMKKVGKMADYNNLKLKLIEQIAKGLV